MNLMRIDKRESKIKEVNQNQRVCTFFSRARREVGTKIVHEKDFPDRESILALLKIRNTTYVCHGFLNSYRNV